MSSDHESVRMSALWLLLEKLECELSTPRQIVMQRMRNLGVGVSSALPPSTDGGGGGGSVDDYFDAADDDAINGSSGSLPEKLLILLKRAYIDWSRKCNTVKAMMKTPHASSESKLMPSLCYLEEMHILQRTLQFLIKVAKMDPTLGEEMIRCRSIGSGGTSNYGSMMKICSRILEQVNQFQCKLGDDLTEEDFDVLVDLQDLVYELKSLPSPSSSSSLLSSSSSSSSQCMPFADDELRSRLPLVYKLMSVHHEKNADGAVQLMKQNQQQAHINQTQQLAGACCNQNAATATTIYIDQVRKRQSAQVDVGFVMWPSAIILSRWLISNPHILIKTTEKKDEEEESGFGKSSSCTILELGAGCGLVGITAAHLLKEIIQDETNKEEKELRDELWHRQQQQPLVKITDVNDLVLENISRNLHLNDVASLASVAKLDFYEQTGYNYSGKWISSGGMNTGVRNDWHADATTTVDEGNQCAQDPVDVILAADIICQPEDAVAASKTIYDALRPGGMAFVVCANAEHRYGVDIFANECEERGLAVVSTDVAEMYDGELLRSEEMDTAAGYIEGMRLTFFEISKVKR
jgi:hypothetical protein